MTTSSISEPNKSVVIPQKQSTSQAMASSPPKEEARHSRRTRRKRAMIIRPQPGSLYDIMHENSNLSLYITPICWSDMHVRLLGVRFRELEQIRHPLPGPKLCGWDDVPPAATANDLARWLTTIVSSDEKTRRWLPQLTAVKSVMKTMFPGTLSQPKTNAQMNLYFGDRLFPNLVRVPVLWRESGNLASFDSAVTVKAPSSTNSQDHTNRPSSSDHSSNPPCRPLLAYLDRKQLKAIRQNLFRIMPGPDGLPNTPVQSLQQLRSKQLLPANEDMDAHYLVVLLAMAQAPFYSDCAEAASQKPIIRFGGGQHINDPPTQFHDITVRLITHADDNADFVVYTANVSATFLERFAHPTKAPTQGADTGLDVTFQRVPVWPILGLKERLAKALGHEIAGDLSKITFEPESNDLETYLSYTEQLNRTVWRQLAAKKSGKKRRRRASPEQRGAPLSEVVNSSFEDDATTSSSSSSPASQRSQSKRGNEDLPVLSPDAKRRCQRAAAANPLTVC